MSRFIEALLALTQQLWTTYFASTSRPAERRALGRLAPFAALHIRMGQVLDPRGPTGSAELDQVGPLLALADQLLGPRGPSPMVGDTHSRPTVRRSAGRWVT